MDIGDIERVWQVEPIETPQPVPTPAPAPTPAPERSSLRLEVVAAPTGRGRRR
jgi:hypothetical protein